MPLIKIDDKEFEVPEGETVLRAALNHGIHIPYYCYHPSLSIAGQCRMCLVEVKGAPKLLTACSTRIGTVPDERKIDGRWDMVVETANEKVRKAQKGVLEFLLLNHPLDCPICDQAGECQLQEYAYSYGNASSRFDFDKLESPKRVDLGPNIVYDSERCIKCTRCIRFCREITGTQELTLVNRGAHARVGVFPGRVLDNPYAMNTVDICPVGALTSRSFRFKERVWFLSSANSVCPECSRGCSIRFDTYKGEVLRLVPRDNPNVNGPWMCDHGRLLSDRLKQRSLLDRPAVREGETWRHYTHESFWDAFRNKTSPFAEAMASDAAVILSGRMTCEELLASKALTDGLFGGMPGTMVRVESGEGDALLKRRDRRPNIKGAELLGFPIADSGTSAFDLLAGRKAALIVREDPLGDARENEKSKVKVALSGLDLLIVADEAFTETAEQADIFIPLAAWHEMEGTTVNFQGVVQKTARALVPPANRRTFWEIVPLWLESCGIEPPDVSYKYWFERFKDNVQALEGLQVRDLLPHGVRLEEVAS
jgi:NADH-quinone oxidoreductase subunit G